MRNEEVLTLIRPNEELTYRLRDHLMRGRLLEFGKGMDEAWQLKRCFSSGISSPTLDQIYRRALDAGAIGGKLMGAGGGGYFLFYVTPFRKHELIDSLEVAGLSIRRFRFDHDGLLAWTMRERKNHLESNDT